MIKKAVRARVIFRHEKKWKPQEQSANYALSAPGPGSGYPGINPGNGIPGSRIFPGSGLNPGFLKITEIFYQFPRTYHIFFWKHNNYAYKLHLIHKKVMNCRCFHQYESFEKIFKKNFKKIFVFVYIFFVICLLFVWWKNPGYPGIFDIFDICPEIVRDRDFDKA